MLKAFKLMPLVPLFLVSFAGSQAVASDYSCYFPVKCTTPDGECILASIRKDFSRTDASSFFEHEGQGVFTFSDFSSIFIQDDGKSTFVHFLNDQDSSAETAHGVCNKGN